MQNTASHLSQYQLCKRWSLSPRTLQRWRSERKNGFEGPRYIKVGNRIVYRLCDIEAYENERCYARTDVKCEPKAQRAA